MLLSTLATAQIRGFCGTADSEAQVERIMANKKRLADAPLMLRSPVVKYVPITFILVANANGNGYPREEQILEQLASLNNLYAPQEMVFYLDEWRYKEHDLIYNQPSHPTAIFQMKLVRDPNAMDIFITNNADSGGSTPGIGLGYYDGVNDWIVVRKSEVDGFSGTTGHEIGHFFSLPHPHLGWGCEPYDEETHGNPVSSIWSPCISSLRVEFQDGSNCENAGDLICDTPPDYNFGFGWSVGGDQCAEFNLDIMDPQGDVVDPMEMNIMGYFIDCPQYEFTPTQMNLVQSDFFSPGRAYLRTGYVPTQTPVTDPVAYNYPINGEETPSFQQVEFDWEDVPGATHYLFIIDRFSTFSLEPERYIVEGSSFEIEELEANRTYYWKVWPYNETQTDAGWSETQNFKTGTSTAVRTIPGVTHFDTYPNPVSEGQLVITLQQPSELSAEIQVIDLAGRVMTRLTDVQIPGDQPWTQSIDVSALPAGLYVLHIRSQEGVLSRKFSIQ